MEKQIEEIQGEFEADSAEPVEPHVLPQLPHELIQYMDWMQQNKKARIKPPINKKKRKAKNKIALNARRKNRK